MCMLPRFWWRRIGALCKRCGVSQNGIGFVSPFFLLLVPSEGVFGDKTHGRLRKSPLVCSGHGCGAAREQMDLPKTKNGWTHQETPVSGGSQRAQHPPATPIHVDEHGILEGVNYIQIEIKSHFLPADG